jgi:hypothetical protein
MAISDTSIKDKADEYVKEVRSRATAYRTSNLLVPYVVAAGRARTRVLHVRTRVLMQLAVSHRFGDDFKFQDPVRQFSNMDKVISYINSQ